MPPVTQFEFTFNTQEYQPTLEDIYELDQIQFKVDTDILIYQHKEEKYKICVSDDLPGVHYITPLMMSVILGDKETFDILLEVCHDEIDTGITYAQFPDDLQIENDLQIGNIIANKGMTALHFAVCNGFIWSDTFDTHFAIELLRAGADPNLFDDQMRTPLMMPFADHIKNDKMKDVTYIIRYLIYKNANVNQRDKFGNTALHYSLDGSCDHSDHFAEILLEAGANLWICNFEGKYPIDFPKRKHKQTIEFLQKKMDEQKNNE